MGLSRRDRAAMVLAYEWCRAPVSRSRLIDNASEALAWSPIGTALRDAEDAECDELDPDGPGWARAYNDVQRLLRARLALYLRAVLRADVGDLGGRDSGLWLEEPHQCGWSCDSDCKVAEPSRYRPIGWRGAVTYRISPLWAQAKPTRSG